MKISKKIIDRLCFKVALLESSGKWFSEKEKFKCEGYVEALKWVFEEEE